MGVTQDDATQCRLALSSRRSGGRRPHASPEPPAGAAGTGGAQGRWCRFVQFDGAARAGPREQRAQRARGLGGRGPKKRPAGPQKGPRGRSQPGPKPTRGAPGEPRRGHAMCAGKAETEQGRPTGARSAARPSPPSAGPASATEPQSGAHRPSARAGGAARGPAAGAPRRSGPRRGRGPGAFGPRSAQKATGGRLIAPDVGRRGQPSARDDATPEQARTPFSSAGKARRQAHRTARCRAMRSRTGFVKAAPGVGRRCGCALGACEHGQPPP